MKVKRDAKDDASIDVNQSYYYASALSETLSISQTPLSVGEWLAGASGGNCA